MSGLKNQETVKFLSGPYSAEWAIDCFLYFPPSFFLNAAINFLSYSDLEFNFFFLFFSLFLPPLLPSCLSPCPDPPIPVPVGVAIGVAVAVAVAIPAAGAAEAAVWGAGGAVAAARPLHPGWAGEDPGSLSGERSENISCAGR